MRLEGCADMHVSYAVMRLGEIRLKACSFLDFRRLGIFPWVALTSYGARYGIFLSWFC